MTTTILSVSKERRLVISDGKETSVHFSHEDSEGRSVAMLNVDREQLLAALPAELGVLLIDGAQEPLAQWEAELLRTGSDDELTAETADALSVYFAWLAAAKRAKPSVDEQQVEALVTLLNETSDGHAQSAPNIARRLIATGKVTVQS